MTKEFQCSFLLEDSSVVTCPIYRKFGVVINE